MVNMFLFLTLCLSWGSTWIAIKVGVETVPPLFFAGTRFVAAGALILIVTGALKGTKELVIPTRDIGPLLLMSALVVSVCFALIFWGEQFVSASVTAIVVQGMIPIFLPFFGFVMGNDRLSPTRLISIAFGIVGLVCIFSPSIGRSVPGSPDQGADWNGLLGLIAIVVGTLAYCNGSVLGRPLLDRNSAVAIAGWQNLLGGIFVLAGSLVLEVPVREAAQFTAILAPDALFAWLWLVVIGSAVGFVLYIVLLKAWGPSKVSPYAFATPIVAIALDYLLFGHVIEQVEILGLFFIFIALGLAFYRPRRKVADSET